MALRLAGILTAAAAVVGCNASMQSSGADRGFGLAATDRTVEKVDAGSRQARNYKLGKPYKVAGRWYEPKDDPAYDEVGRASWYGDHFHGQETANGEIYDMNGLTAAHPTLPMPTYVRVTNLENERSVVVRVNDRGPFARNRVIDLSKQAARKLGFKGQGTAEVRVQHVGTAMLENDNEWLSTAVRDNGETVSSTLMAGAGDEPAAASGSPQEGQAAPADPAPEPTPAVALASGYADRNQRNAVAETFRLFDEDGAQPSHLPLRGLWRTTNHSN